MKKIAIVINGAGGVGKDTLCDMASRRYKVYNVSSITPIKELAAQCGWKGEKTDKARKFLSDLKLLTVEYNDFPTNWVLARYREFLESDNEIMFIHIREGEEIDKFVRGTDGEARTLLIRGGKRCEQIHGERYGNKSDDDVENYDYDYVYVNEHSLEETETKFIEFLSRIVK